MRFSRLCIIFFLVISLFSCSTVPITGRKQIIMIPSATMLSMSFQQYGEFLQSHQISNDQQQTQMVKRAGKRIQQAVEKYFVENNMSGELKNYNWEFNLVEDQTMNAWCMPGGKVVVYTGILPVTQNETALAVVMGHEIAHAIAGHGNERMSQGLIAQLGGTALSVALKDKPEETQKLWMQAFGVGAQIGLILPYSRLHESEADRLGLIFMAMAGYDPNEAVTFWQRMSQQKSGNTTAEFLSTHPSDTTRIRKIQQAMPEAMRYYRR